MIIMCFMRMPGSIRVKEGQVLGLLGNTGNSAQLHLHMQVMDANDELKVRNTLCI